MQSTKTPITKKCPSMVGTKEVDQNRGDTKRDSIATQYKVFEAVLLSHLKQCYTYKQKYYKDWKKRLVSSMFIKDSCLCPYCESLIWTTLLSKIGQFITPLPGAVCATSK